MSILENHINKFLYDRPVEGYKKDLGVFKKFLKEVKRINPESIDYFIQGFRTDGIIESLDFYIRDNDLTSINTARRYSSCLREFLRYIIHHNNIENGELRFELGAPAYDEKSFTFKINSYISQDKRLKETEGFIAINKTDRDSLIEESDLTLKSEKIFKKAIKQQKYYNKFRSALIMKLTLLTGVKYEILRTIGKKDLNLKHDLITINDLMIRLPINLSEDFYKYEEINSKIARSNLDRDIFFIEYNKSVISNKTATTSSFLKGILGRGDLNGIIKYTISEMIKKGVNESIIKKFTGIGSKTFDECQEYVNNLYQIKTNRYLDSKIRSMEIFDLL